MGGHPFCGAPVQSVFIHLFPCIGDRSQTSLLSNRFTSNVGLREKKEAISSLRTETSEVESEETIDEEQLKKVQEHMLQYYITEAYKKKDGPPSSLPIFCNNCYRPFTYPIGAISIKCPMCLSVNIIPTSCASKQQYTFF